jgi:hypothetical protein
MCARTFLSAIIECTKKSKKVSTVDESQIKGKLERALHTRISAAEWLDFKEDRVVTEYDELPWPEFRDWADEKLRRLRRYLYNVRREEAGELETGDAKPSRVDSQETGEDAPPIGLRIGRTRARSEAMTALDRLRAREGGPKGRARISKTVRPRGGVDGTIPHWVILMGVEAWVPASEVAESYSRLQETFLAERRPPKTSERSFQVARFVWEEERIQGTRPPWPVLCERWNRLPLTEPFERWRDFHTSFVRGAKATPPRYVASEVEITEQVRSRAHDGGLDYWAEPFRW